MWRNYVLYKHHVHIYIYIHIKPCFEDRNLASLTVLASIKQTLDWWSVASMAWGGSWRLQRNYGSFGAWALLNCLRGVCLKQVAGILLASQFPSKLLNILSNQTSSFHVYKRCFLMLLWMVPPFSIQLIAKICWKHDMLIFIYVTHTWDNNQPGPCPMIFIYNFCFVSHRELTKKGEEMKRTSRTTKIKNSKR